MTIRVAACQIDPQIGEVEANLARIERAVTEAASAGASSPWCPRRRSPATRSPRSTRRAGRAPGEPSSPPTGSGHGRGARITVIAGTLEAEGDAVYNAADPDRAGGQQLTYRKMHLPFLGVDRFATPGPGAAMGGRGRRDAGRGPHLLRPPLPRGGPRLRPRGRRPHLPAHELADRGRVPSRPVRAGARRGEPLLPPRRGPGRHRARDDVHGPLRVRRPGRGAAGGRLRHRRGAAPRRGRRRARAPRPTCGAVPASTSGTRSRTAGPGLYARLGEPGVDRLHRRCLEC